MAIRIGDEVLESAEGSATFDGINLTRIKYYNDVVWDKGVDMTMTNGLNLIIISRGKRLGDEGYVMVRMADSNNGQGITPSCVCFSNVANPYNFGIKVVTIACGHVKIGDDWYEFGNECAVSNETVVSISDTCEAPLNLGSHTYPAYKSQYTYDSDELRFQECYLQVCNRTTKRQYKLPWQQGQTYCV